MTIERINKGNWGKIRAFFDLKTEDGFIIKGFKLIEGINGMFVGFPSQKNKDNEYFDTVIADRDVKEKLTQLAIKEYGQDIMSDTLESGYTQAPQAVESSDSFSDDDIPF